jgi:hypothetical protein
MLPRTVIMNTHNTAATAASEDTKVSRRNTVATGIPTIPAKNMTTPLILFLLPPPYPSSEPGYFVLTFYYLISIYM